MKLAVPAARTRQHAPVCPYANRVPLYPSMAAATMGCPTASYTSAVWVSGGKTKSYVCSRVTMPLGPPAMEPPVSVDFSYSTPASGSYTHASSSAMFCSTSFSGRLRTPTTTLDGLLAALERSMAASAVLRASSTSPPLPGGDDTEPPITEPSRRRTKEPDGEVSSPVGEKDAMWPRCGRPPDPPLAPPPPLCAEAKE